MALAAIASAAGAQEAASNAQARGEAQLDEVVVTARRVAENLQEVPVAVTAISGEAVKERGIVSTTDVMFAAPSVQMTTTFGRLSGAFSVRGLANGTQTYFAEVPGGPTESAAPFYDIASVQVLNGPQGTLFGRANTAGAVLVEPAKPEFDRFYGSVEAAYGNLDLFRATGIVNVPVIPDMLAVRLAVHKDHLDGYVKTFPDIGRLSSSNSQEARFSVNFKAFNDRFTSYSVLDYYDVDQAASGVTLAAINPNVALLNLPASIDAPNGLTIGTQRFGAPCAQAVAAGLSPNLNACIDQRLRIAATLKPALIAEYERIRNGGHDAVRSTPGDTSLEQAELLRKWTFVNQSAIDFGTLFDFTTVSLRNIFSYQAARGATGWDTDGMGGLIQSSVSVGQLTAYAFSVAAQQQGNIGLVGVGPYQKVYTNETQLRGSVKDGLLVWSMGGYYQKNPNPHNLEGVRNISRTNSGIGLATLGYNPSFPFSDGGQTTQRAVYAQGTADVSFVAPFIEALHFTYGYRKSWDKAELFTRPVVTELPSGRYVPGAARNRSFTKSDGVNTTLSLDGQVTPDLLVYGATRKGYRPGGLNLVLNSAGLPNFKPEYDPETVRDYELGAKWDFHVADARARLNAALYRTEYSNIQRTFNAAVAGVTTTYVVNASAAVIKGAEFQGQVVFGDWSVSGTYAYADAKFTDWVGADPLALITPGNARCIPPSTASLCLIDLSNNPFPNISKHQGSVTVKYALPLADDQGQASVQGTLYAQSRRYFSDAGARNLEQYGPGVLGALSQGGFSRINLRADWKNIRGTTWSAGAFVNNLTDANYKLTAITQLHSLGTGTVIYGEPRTYGLEVRYAFGN
ncbi:TonB-dependent receptor [Phenylobacterium sp.]|uniref:TonB-dependent receptor n=1 Tax=Phenylobacterium sp. TaxID=1871053 RepID=UPI0025CDDDC7|nr:TonB-dependent receptor [Phenylobacterium sp.]MBX3484118.1 TonB-dependent receptor plug domain-containing protein [Phenylobacterium sp.]